MPQGVLLRFIKYMAVATFVMFTFWMGWQWLSPDQSGDYWVRHGDIRLGEGEYDEAITSFDKALAEQPDHRGALMGRGIAFLQSNRLAEAEAEFTYLIDYLGKTLAADDPTGRGVLASAYANRGILYDRTARYELALADYIQALRIDQGAVEGPGWVDKVLYGTPKPSTVRDRAIYLTEQLKLPPEQRLLQVPEVDEQQRMYKP